LANRWEKVKNMPDVGVPYNARAERGGEGVEKRPAKNKTKINARKIRKLKKIRDVDMVEEVLRG